MTASRRKNFAVLIPLALLLAGLATLAPAAWVQGSEAAGFAASNIVLEPARYPFTFVGYGDIRFTNPADTWHSNAAARRALLEGIAEEKPQFVVMDGDLVFRGASGEDWAEFDRETRGLREAGVRIFAALGNHDLAGSESAALANYFQRFPQVQGRRWYSLRAGNVMVLVLDSNSDDKAGSAQRRWLEAGLAALPADVDFVLLITHHPPYTHSGLHVFGGGHRVRPQEQALAALLEERQKTLRARIVVIAGHVHNYERYEHGGVMYLVSGGGGATPYTIPRSPGDFYSENGTTYHYCKFTVDRSLLKVEMVKLSLEGGEPAWAVKDSFELRPTDCCAKPQGPGL